MFFSNNILLVSWSISSAALEEFGTGGVSANANTGVINIKINASIVNCFIFLSKSRPPFHILINMHKISAINFTYLDTH